jgi:predicted nuclease of predicted toxin-antitoxin system
VRVLLDECVPARLKGAFPGHAVQTVTECGWRSGKDSPLLTFAQTKFDVFVTVDRRLEIEHNLGEFRIGFIVVHVPNNRLESFVPIFDQLRTAVESVGLGRVLHIRAQRQ